MTNIFPIDFEEKLTMAQDDYILFSDSEDGNKIKKAQYKNLKGEPGTPGQDGEDGAAATITVGSTTTGAAGSSASVTNVGTSSAAILDFTIPQGAKGEPGEDGQDGADGAAATITAGTTTTLSPGSSATVTNSGTSSAAVFNFGIPQGATGATGNGIASITSSKAGKTTTVTITETNGTVDTFQVQDGEGAGDVVGPSSSTDGDIAVFDGATGKLIKDGGTTISGITSSISTNTTAISTINGKIPSAATSSNQLADKDYVNDGINSVTAYYITKNAQGDQWSTRAELFAATTFYSGGVVRVPTKNDYTIVLADEQHDNATTRYIYNSGWEYQYTVNETALTQAQLDALNSGITAAKVSTYDGLNTKTFYLSSSTDLTTAQAAYDWYLAGKNPIVMYQEASYDLLKDLGSAILTFINSQMVTTNSGVYNRLNQNVLKFFHNASSVTSITATTESALSGGMLFTGINYSNPYTPEYNGSPATKKYVDDAIAGVGGGDVLVSDQANNIFTPGMKIWGGTESDYQSLTPDSNTAYLLLAGGPTPIDRPDITTATQDQNIQPTYISNNRCIEVSSDGYHILLANEGGPIYEYTLSTPFDLTSTITSQTANLMVGIYTNCAVYSNDGSYIYVSDSHGGGQTAYITQRELSTPFDISTAGAVIKTSPGIPGTAEHGIGGFRFYDNGTKIIGVYRSGYIISATLSTAWDISTMGTITVQTTQGQYGNYGEGFAISPDGMNCYLVSEYESNIAQLTTTNAYDFSNATKTTRSESLSGNKFGIKVTDDGKYCFIATQNGTIYRYSFQEL